MPDDDHSQTETIDGLFKKKSKKSVFLFEAGLHRGRWSQVRRKKNLVSWMRWRRSTVRTHRAYRAGIRNQQSFIWRAEYDDLWLGTKIKAAATMPPPSSLLTCIQEEGGFIKVNQSYARIGGGPLLPARAREMDPRQTCVVEQVSPPTYT